MNKKKLRYFVSYAHKNEVLAHHFLDNFRDHAGLHKNYQFEQWIDGDIIIGERWHDQIQKAIKECDFGLLLLSAAYFNRNYIKNEELPKFLSQLGGDKIQIGIPIVPVGLEAFDLGGDLLGLQHAQIYRYAPKLGAAAKFYNQLQRNHRIGFTQDVLQKMTLKFDQLVAGGMI